MGYIEVITHLLTIDPNFLGHPSSRIDPQFRGHADWFVFETAASVGGLAIQRYLV